MDAKGMRAQSTHAEVFEDDVEVVEVHTGSRVEQAREEGLWTSLVKLARKEPRDWRLIVREAVAMVTFSEDAAKACFYALPRGGKQIVGPSIHLAKAIQASAGSIAIRARSVREDEKFVEVSVAAMDLCKMNYVEVSARRRITDKSGNRYNQDMIDMTANAAMSIAHRNGVLRLIPEFVVSQVASAARQCAIGDIASLAEKRADALEILHKARVTDDRILSVLDVQTTDQIDGDGLLVLGSLYRQMRDEGKTIEEAFPLPQEKRAGAGTPSAKDAIDALAKLKGAAQKSVQDATTAQGADRVANGTDIQSNGEKTVEKSPQRPPVESEVDSAAREPGEDPIEESETERLLTQEETNLIWGTAGMACRAAGCRATKETLKAAVAEILGPLGWAKLSDVPRGRFDQVMQAVQEFQGWSRTSAKEDGNG